ncbi:putative Eukaryotic peptide chain release factor GTP-binding subunit ERF3A [Paratrimastix pyriformis]|uniref:Eukaryotic peptide chain release factor GTP-binding subunit ERF3A n=1 Tax=Paratrimastix pyriformis TaxID=342808 RepID=A0ABQ8USP8_9EUKA|nr:putative Eukaryotic peptide chain release factor GTP-binding subunit ERF3A [Paratrimastix pyriformis]
MASRHRNIHIDEDDYDDGDDYSSSEDDYVAGGDDDDDVPVKPSRPTPPSKPPTPAPKAPTPPSKASTPAPKVPTPKPSAAKPASKAAQTPAKASMAPPAASRPPSKPATPTPAKSTPPPASPAVLMPPSPAPAPAPGKSAGLPTSALARCSLVEQQQHQAAIDAGFAPAELGTGRAEASPDILSGVASSPADISPPPPPPPTGPLKEGVNLVIIGHVDAGKSTLMGHFLYLMGQVSQKVMHKYEKESREMGKGSFAYAWVMDSHAEERERGVTMDVSTAFFETANKRVTVLDTPGHADFVPNMISGAAQADAAVLVVDAVPGAFEAGFHSSGQTREHALLAKGLGVSHLLVAVNKIDTVPADRSEERFKEIVTGMRPFLTAQVGFAPGALQFIPVSGLLGWNLKEPPPRPRPPPREEDAEPENTIAWYHGPTLLQAIDTLALARQRRVDLPLRLSISDVYLRPNQPGLVVSGRVEGGIVRQGEQLIAAPAGHPATVRAIELNERPAGMAQCGDHVEVVLTGIEINRIAAGDVLCGAGAPPIRPVLRFEAQILALAVAPPLMRGTQAVLYVQSRTEAVTITRLIHTLDKQGAPAKKNPRLLPRGTTALVEITARGPICLELAAQYRQLGRFVLRQGGQSVGAGIVSKLLA